MSSQLILAAVLIATAAYLFITYVPARRASVTGPSVALTGAPDAGKTTLFSTLTLANRPKTHTSLIPSRAPLPGTAVTLIDLPGHPRMRAQTHKVLMDPGVRGVLFLVDVVALIRNSAVVAEELVEVLTALSSTNTPRHLLIVATKTDLLIPPPTTTSTPTSTTQEPGIPAKTHALAIDRLRTLLTRDLTRIKSTHTSQSGRIEGIDPVPTARSITGLLTRLFGGREVVPEHAEREGAVWGGNGPFVWDEIEGVRVEFGVATAFREGGLDDVRGWLDAL